MDIINLMDFEDPSEKNKISWDFGVVRNFYIVQPIFVLWFIFLWLSLINREQLPSWGVMHIVSLDTFEILDEQNILIPS